MRSHLEMAARERMERGEAPGDAKHKARREFGNVALVKEVTRDTWGWRWVEVLLEDARYGLRMLSKNKGFTAIAVLTLALGIGANTAIFSMIDAALLHALPVRDADRVLLLEWQAHKPPKYRSYSSYGDCPTGDYSTRSTGCSFSEPFFRALQKETAALSVLAAFANGNRLDLSGNGPASTLDNPEYVSGDFFELLGVKPAVGRLLAPEDDNNASAPVVVLSYRYWRSQFGGSPGIVGKTILLNRIQTTIIGVAEERFDALSPGNLHDVWIPLAMQSPLEHSVDNRSTDPSNWRLVLIGRLKPEATASQAQAQASALFQNEMTHGEKPMSKPEDGATIVVTPIQQGLVGNRGDISAPLYVMMFVVGIILLIACANVAGLLLARATSRQKEMAVRLALGASRARIMRQLLTESLMLSLAGGALGILLASWCIASIQAFVSSTQDGPPGLSPSLNSTVLLFTAAVSVLTGILFGLAPAIRGMRVDLTPSLKAGAAGSSPTKRPAKKWLSTGNGLVVAQVALSIVVLAAAGLLMRTLQNLKNIDPGFDTRNVLTFSLDPTLTGYKQTDTNNFYRQLQSRLAAMPGVMSVSYSWTPLLGNNLWTSGFHLAGKPKDEESNTDMLLIGPGFFNTMRIRLVAGRDFTAADFARAEFIDAAQAARRAKDQAKPKPGEKSPAKTAPEEDLPPIPSIVNQSFAKKYFPSVNPVGRIFGEVAADPEKDVRKSAGWEIVGVVSDAKYSALRRGIEPTTYVPENGGAVSFALRTETDPTKFVPRIRALVTQMDSNLPVFQVATESQNVEQQIFKERLIATLSGVFGALALLLACIGLYGLVSYEVAQRTREIGIRAALGAERRDVLRLVLYQGMRLAMVGASLGIALALPVTHLAKDLLFGVKAADPLTYLAVTLLLVGVTLAACYAPARRATRVDPVVALRYE